MLGRRDMLIEMLTDVIRFMSQPLSSWILLHPRTRFNHDLEAAHLEHAFRIKHILYSPNAVRRMRECGQEKISFCSSAVKFLARICFHDLASDGSCRMLTTAYSYATPSTFLVTSTLVLSQK